jgi:hypothetical protein
MDKLTNKDKPQNEDDGNTKGKMTSLKRLPPKRQDIKDNITQSSSRFILGTSAKTETTTAVKQAPVLPSFVFKKTPLPETTLTSKESPSSLLTTLQPSKSKITSISPVKEFRKSTGHEVSEDDVDDPCTQFNFFLYSNLSCYIDSLLFSLLHKFENNFILELQRLLEFEDHSDENCKVKVIRAILSFYQDIHQKTKPIKRTHSAPFRELLYECDTQRQTVDIPKSVYINSQQDPHDFFSKILNIIGHTETDYTVIKKYTHPQGTQALVENFGEYNTIVNLQTYNSLLIYTQTNESRVIDIGFNQIDENTFAFNTPLENSVFEKATSLYPDVVDFIYNHKLIDSSIIERITENDPDLLDFFKPDIDIEIRCLYYELIYKRHIMVYSAAQNKEVEQFTYQADLPKLTYTKSSNSTIFSNPVNYFVISITRELDTDHRNNYDLINVPERILSHGKTLQLVSAVVHIGSVIEAGHYICYFKCGDHWYIMDNLKSNITQYAPFNIRNSKIMSNCRMLVYM